MKNKKRVMLTTHDYSNRSSFVDVEELLKENKKTPFEEQEDIEILRFLEMGYEVQMIKMSKVSIPIDNPEDIKKVLKHIADAG